MDPFDYMVEDCWLHLFNFLSAEDKHSLCQTCETFYAMLQPQKTNWAFGLIFPHISKYLLPILPYGSSRYLNLNQRLAFNLKFRLVSKSWKVSFDKLCALHRNDHCRTQHSINIQQHYNLQNVSKLETFLDFFKGTHPDNQGNPFIGRVVTICATSAEKLEEDEEPEVNDEGSAAAEEIEEDDEDEADEPWRAEYEIFLRERRERSLKYKDLQMELLLRYGEEIEYLTLNGIRRHDRDLNHCIQIDACKQLQVILCNTPNLQSLELSLHPFIYQPEECTFLPTELVEYFEANPLPKMPTLRELSLKQNNPKMETLLLEAYGGHVQTLLTNNSLQIPLSVWSNMKCLKNLTLHRSDFANNEKILQAIQSPLESLSIYELSRYMMNPVQFLIDKFLLAVQHLPLKEVMVHSASNIVKESVPFPADFPKHLSITKLTFQGIRSTSLNFLRFVPNLEKLVVGDKEFPFPTNVFRQMN